MVKFEKYDLPREGTPITMENGKLNVPDNPIIPFIEGDGIGPDIWAAASRILDAAVEKAYAGKRKLPGMKSMPAKRLLINLANGCLPIL